MKHYFYLLALAAFLCTGCFPTTRIVTVSPDTGGYGTYSTTVTYPRTRTSTTSTRVYAADNDISLHLDLQAIGAAFAQSRTIEEFENLINDASYMLSNLDLNGDGYVDYLRVMETLESHNHVFLIQAVLGNNVYQDVATLVAEVTSTSRAYVQIIGAPYIYGPAYYIEPVYIATPLIYAHLYRAAYSPWRSPWYWNHFPPCYRHPRHLYAGHYQAYVNTYMRNHHFCHEFHYATVCHFPAYDRISRPMMRNDYGVQHPERSFTTRTANLPSVSASGRVSNARDIREYRDAVTVTNSSSRTPSGYSSSSRTTSGTSAASSRTASGSSATTSRTASGTTATSSRAASGTASAATTTGTTSRTSSGSSTSSSRTASVTTGTTSRTTSGSTATSTSSRTSSGSTTVKSRVSSSGSTNTNIRTTSSSGRTSSSSRVSSGSSSSSSRSVSAGSTSRTSSSSPSRTSSSISSSRSASSSSSSSRTASSSRR